MTITELLLPPKAQMHGDPPGISIREKLHSELKYFGSNLLVDACKNEAAADCLLLPFLASLSIAKMWTVPWLLDAHNRLESELKKNVRNTHRLLF